MTRITFLTAFLLFSAASWAQEVSGLKRDGDSKVEVSGFLNLTLANRSQSAVFEGSKLLDSENGTHNRYANENAAALDAEVYLGAGRRDFGVKYGVIGEVENDSVTDGYNEGVRFDKAFLFAESFLGKIEVGNNNAANQKMKVGVGNFARATGGVVGKYLNHVNLPILADSVFVDGVCGGGASSAGCANVKLPRFILIPQAPIAHGGGAKGFYAKTVDNNYQNGNNGYGGYNFSTKSNPLYGYKNGSFQQFDDATKVGFYTPRLDGLQIGVSFAPDASDQGVTSQVGVVDGGVKNVVSWGVNYVDYLDNLGFAFSLSGEHGAYDKTGLPGEIVKQRLDAYDFGAMASYFGFTFGGSYGHWGDSLAPKSGIYSCDYDESQNLTAQDCSSGQRFGGAYYYSLGVAYEFGPVSASLTHFSSEFAKNEYAATSFGVDYRLKKGVMPYFEVTYFDFNSNRPKFAGLARDAQMLDNRGYVGLLGILVSF